LEWVIGASCGRQSLRRENLVAAPGTSLNSSTVRRSLQITLLLLLLLVGIGGRYVYNKGLTKPWREWMVAEVRKHGVEVSLGRLTVRPFKGLVAKDVKVYDSPARMRVLARVNEMIVEPNYANAVRGQAFLDALTLVGASVRVPLDPKRPDGPSVNVDKLNARVLFPPNQVHVSRVDAEILGIRVRASGNLAVPAGTSLFREKAGANARHWETLVAEIRALRYEEGPPQMDVRFGGDLGRPEGVVVEVDLTARGIRHGGYRLESLAVAGSWQNNLLRLARLDAADSVGRLQASGSYDPKVRVAEVRLRSGMDLPALAQSLKLWPLEDVSFQSPPRLELTARLDFAAANDGAGPKCQALAQLRCGRFRHGKMPFEELSADLSWDGRRWAMRDVVLRHAGGGELRGDAQQDFDEAGKGDFRAGFTSTLRPDLLIPLLKPADAAWLAALKFYDLPKVTISARGSAPGLDTLSVSGDLRLGRTAFRGVEAKQAQTSFRYSNRVLTLDSLEVVRSEGSASGKIVFDSKAGTVTLKDVRTTLTPVEIAPWVDPKIVPDIKPYRFGKKPPSLLIDGVFDPRRGGTRTRLNVTADAPHGLDYTFCGKELHFTEAKGKLFFTDERVKLSDVRAELFGGTVTGQGDFSLIKAKPGHAASVQLAGVDFSTVSKLYFDYEDSKGKLDGVCNFSGKGDDARFLRGEGEITVTDGNVFAIPFLGPFSEIMNKIIPGAGYNQARKASASFSIGDGIVTTKDLLIAGRGFSMIGGGRLWFIDDRMDFDIRINAQGLPGVVLFPVSKLLEYRANSKLSKPEWRARVMPRLGRERN
jgi:hypothetical protein